MDFLHYLIQNLPELSARTVAIVTPIIIGSSIGRKLAIVKESKPQNIKKLTLPPEIKHTYPKINVTNKEIVDFIQVLEEQLPKSCLINMNRNLSYLKVNNNKLISFIGAGGLYIPRSNSIVLSDKKVIYHELFHMASTVKGYDDTVYCGFSQGKKLKFSVGNGLNEGYTEVLTKRYFSDKKLPMTYDIEVDIARKIEKIVGKERMTELYFEGNLLGLIEELKQYSTEEEIMNFIANLDLIFLRGSDTDIFKSRTIQNSIKNMINFLLKTHMRYLQKQLDEGVITEEECYEMHGEYVESFAKMIHVSIHKYKAIENKDIYKVYDELNKEKEIKR